MRKTLKFMVYKLPLFMAMFVGIFYMLIIFQNYEKDTTTITNIAFAITATFAALCFSIAGLIESNSLKDRFTFSGERLFHASISLSVASILKYTLLSIKEIEFISSHKTVDSAVSIILGALVGFIFFSALLHIHTGLRIANDLLWERQARKSDWDDSF